MIMNRALVGTTVLNKVNGKMYQITEIVEGVAIACELIDDKVNPEAPVTIKEENAICFRVLKDAEEKIPEGYSVNNGILLKSGVATIEQGELFFKKLVGTIKGYVILQTKDSLTSYQPSRDRFYHLCDIEEEAELKLLDSDETSIRMAYSIVAEEEVAKDDDTVEKKEVLKRSVYISTDGRNVDYRNLNFPIEQYLSGYLFMDKHVKDGYLEETTPCYVSAENGSIEYVGFKAEKVVSSAAGKLYIGDKELYLIDNDGDFIRIMDPSIASELKGYDHVVDIRKGSNRYETLISFATNECDVKTLSRTATVDRGAIYKLVD